MPLTLGNLDTRLQFLIGDTSSGAQTDRYNALADADLELSSIAGPWLTRSFTYTTTSSPAMSADSYQLAVPSTFELPYLLYYRESGRPRMVKFLSRRQWLWRSDTSQQDYPRWASLVYTGSAYQIELDRKLSSAFVSTIASLVLEYQRTITRLSASGDISILPDSLQHHILPVAGVFYAMGQRDRELAEQLRPDAERAREAVLKWDLEHVAEPRHIEPSNDYVPSDVSESSDYGVGV